MQNRCLRRVVSLAIVSFVVSTSALSFAQDDDKIVEYVPAEEIKSVDIEDRRGLDGLLGVNGTLSLVQNDSVVGQNDGLSILFGLGVEGGLDWVNGRHELRSSLSIDESWARTPVLEEFIKSDDEIDLESLYNYFFIDWAGFFGRLNFNSALLPTEDVNAEPVTYRINRNDGTTDTIADVTRLELSGSFEPFAMAQSTGVFAEPIQEKPISLSVRLGVGARETFADGVLVIDDDDATPETDVTELTNVFQGGGEAFVGARGKAYKDRLSYEVGASVLVPILNNDDQDRSAAELTRYAANAALNFSVFSWMGLTYKLRVVRDPQLVEDTQIQNNLLLSFNYTLIERSESEAPDPTEVKLQKAKEEVEEAKEAEAAARGRAEAAEERAKEAERRAVAAKAEAAAARAKAEAADEAEAVEEAEEAEEEAPEAPGETPEETSEEGAE